MCFRSVVIDTVSRLFGTGWTGDRGTVCGPVSDGGRGLRGRTGVGTGVSRRLFHVIGHLRLDVRRGCPSALRKLVFLVSTICHLGWFHPFLRKSDFDLFI